MRTAPPPLLPLLRSQVQGELLALLFLHPDREYSLTDVAREIGSSVKAVHQEASRLVDAGLVTDSRRGNVRLLRAATDNPVARALTDLLAVTYGPLPVLTDLLGNVDGVEQAFIYGSWAARYQGQAGPIPVDIDVLVVGTADPDELQECAEVASNRLGRTVDIRRVRSKIWRAAKSSDPFLASIRSRPLCEIPIQRTHGRV